MRQKMQSTGAEDTRGQVPVKAIAATCGFSGLAGLERTSGTPYCRVCTEQDAGSPKGPGAEALRSGGTQAEVQARRLFGAEADGAQVEPAVCSVQPFFRRWSMPRPGGVRGTGSA